MIVTIHPSGLQGSITAPASKSSMQRACAAALLSRGRTEILNPGVSNDDLSALDVITKLGARIISHSNEKLVIESDGVNPVSPILDCGESGLGIRMFTPLAALSDKKLSITGTGSLLTRPMHFFDQVFPALGIKVRSNAGYLPIEILGPLRPTDIEIDGSLSSQFLTGLLMAFAAAGAEGVEIRVSNLKSKPYIDLTLEVIKHFGIDIENNDYKSFRFPKIQLPLPEGDGVSPSDFIVQNTAYDTGFKATTYTVEGDWSGGAFLLVAGAIAGGLTVHGLSTASAQADKNIMQALKDAGADLRESEGSISCSAARLKAFEFDATDCPDLFPPLVALAAYCQGATRIQGVSRLEHKESNRGITLQEEFRKMGVVIQLEGDTMRVTGGEGVTGAKVHSRHDHRIAMACAVAALSASGSTTIEEAGAVRKSFPDFYDILQRAGATINQ